MNTFKRSTVFAGLMLCAFSMFGANRVAVQSNRSYSAAGAAGCTVSGASVATPSVITCAAAHNLVSGDQVQITGIGGTTTDNTLAYVNVLTSTTFGIYSDAGLATGITGTGTYTSGGAVSAAYDISGITSDFTIRLRVESLTAAKKVLVSVQDSADGFASDIKTLGVFNVLGGVNQGAGIDYTIRSYQIPSARFGVTNGRLRIYVQSIDGSTTAAFTLMLE